MPTTGIEACVQAAKQYCFNSVTRRRYLLIRLLVALGFRQINGEYVYNSPEGGLPIKVKLD